MMYNTDKFREQWNKHQSPEELFGLIGYQISELTDTVINICKWIVGQEKLNEVEDYQI